MLLNSLTPYSFNNRFLVPSISKINNNIQTQTQTFKPVSSETLKAYSFGSSIEKREKIYSDTGKFAEHILAKIDKQLMIPNRKEIKRIVNTVANETNASRKLVKEVVARVTQFSSPS